MLMLCYIFRLWLLATKHTDTQIHGKTNRYRDRHTDIYYVFVSGRGGGRGGAGEGEGARERGIECILYGYS
jgi:hypothetical protein